MSSGTKIKKSFSKIGKKPGKQLKKAKKLTLQSWN